MTAGTAVIRGAPDSTPEPASHWAALLVDFDNLQPPNSGLEPSEVRHRLLECIRNLLLIDPGTEYIRIRLYGGWMSTGILSRRGSEVAGISRHVDPFPIMRLGLAAIGGTIELVTALITLPEVTFEDTYRQRAAPPRLRIAPDFDASQCTMEQNPGLCPVRVLKRFTKGSDRICEVAGCTRTPTDAFVVHEQKMVDAMLSCDLLELATDSNYSTVSVVSADTDFVPSVLYAARRSSAKLLVQVPMTGWSPDNTSILEAHRIEVQQMENPDGS